jgi:sulfite reductase (NADPH) flavoprotein alpha-component
MSPPVPFIPETAPFTAEQRAWLNGFLAGLFAQTSAAGTPAESPATAEPLLIMFGSQTGTAEGLAKRFAKDAREKGFSPRVLPLNEYQTADLAHSSRLLIVSSTWGEGDPPDNATAFWTWLNSDSAPTLDHLQFAVLGLGDKNYSDFCGASKKFDARLATLGARRLIPRGECDVDYESAARAWIESLWPKLRDPALSPSPQPGDPIINHQSSIINGDASPWTKSNPFPASLLKNILLSQPGSGKEVRHYEIGLDGSGLAYQPGDALGIVPSNCPDLVRDILSALNVPRDCIVRLADRDMPLEHALLCEFDITRPSQDLLRTVARRIPDSDVARLLAPERSADLKQWLYGRDVLDVLNLLPEPVSPSEFVSTLRKLAPRLYSIASSSKAHPGEVHLTVSAVRYEGHNRRRKGVASTFLADRVHAGALAKSGVAQDSDSAFVIGHLSFHHPASLLPVFVQSTASFKLPPSPDTPIIMVGPGTGIAPFRAFLEERESCAASGKNWLFFGDQKFASDFLYQDQITAWKKAGHLTRLDLAFSRDQAEKIYVQHRMLENGDELWRWLEAGAHFYVCGDAARMAKDVDAALHQIVQTAGGKSPEAANEYVQNLKTRKRYQRDVY